MSNFEIIEFHDLGICLFGRSCIRNDCHLPLSLDIKILFQIWTSGPIKSVAGPLTLFLQNCVSPEIPRG